MLRCTGCGQEKDASAFPPDRRQVHRQGRAHRCRACARRDQRHRRAVNRMARMSRHHRANVAGLKTTESASENQRNDILRTLLRPLGLR